MKNKVLIKYFLLTIEISWVLCKCELTIEDADKCGLNAMFFGNREVLIPTNEQEMDQHCGNIRTNMKCIRDFTTNCLDGFVKQTMNMVLTNADKHIGRQCDKPKDRQEFLSHVKCIKEREKIEPFHICTDKNLIMMERLKDVDADDRIGAMCCIFHSYQNCIRTNNKQICGEETTNYWDEVINDMAEDSMTFSCTDFGTLDKCDKSLNPKVWNDIKALADSNDPKVLAQRHKFGSGIALSIDLMKKFSM